MKVIVSTKDPASMNIKKNLESQGYKDSVIIKDDLIHSKLGIKDDYLIFASKHKSEKGIPSLTVHATGNFSDDITYGGKPKKLSQASPSKMKIAIEELMFHKKELGSKCKISLECTHHGPFLKSPSFFIEIGSTEKEWKTTELGNIIAKVILKVIERDEKNTPVIGIGGGHYSEKFTTYMLRTEQAFGHICPKYNIKYLNEKMIKQMLKMSDAEKVIIDWKGTTKEQKEFIFKILKKNDIRWEKV
jgi:D-aminoacyl-tRNA deacylase